MSCGPRMERRLAEWAEGSLPERRRRRLARHLQGCPDCRSELAALQALRGQLVEWLGEGRPRPQLSDEAFARTVIARAGAASERAGRSWNWGLAAAAGATAVLALLLFAPRPADRTTGAGEDLSRLVLASPYTEELLAEEAGDPAAWPDAGLTDLAADVQASDLAGLDPVPLLAGDLADALESAAAESLLYPSEDQVLQDLESDEIPVFFEMLKEA